MNDPTAVPMHSVPDLLAGLPHLIGFYPVDSLVIVNAHHRHSGQPRLGATMRASLPAPEHYAQFLSYLLTGPLQTLQPDAVLLFVITHPDTEQPDGLPHHQLISGLLDALTTAGLPVLTAAWTPDIHDGAEWISYLDPDLRGTVGDPTTSVLGAELAARGHVLFSSREDMCALIAPERDGATAAEWAVKLDGLGLDDTGTDAVAERVEAIAAAIAGIAGDAYPDEDSLVRMLHWISDRRVRDALLPTALGEHAGAAENLWITLVRKAPAPELADVATLLAVSTYVRGEGALTQIALGRALEADPEHTLADLIRHTLDSGIPPSEFAQFLRHYTDTTDATK
ncbi:DUF4192 domain-containing protein [Saccharopolyspora sp. NPDC049426]|uniref:DUF4192 domain-containing protein n=1 Tax=Saccharopolyspora sp. NPDC049426 TaxID=3155652 RepID=UPI0034344EED